MAKNIPQAGDHIEPLRNRLHAQVLSPHCPHFQLARCLSRHFCAGLEQDHFADAITADLTTDLARTPATFVVGRETAFTYKNKSIDLKQLGTDLGIRWAVHGAVRRNGDQVRINVSLTDLQTARDIWSDRFDGDRTNLAVLRDNITARLLCIAHLHLRQYEEAIEQCSRSLNIGANFQAYIS